MKTRKARLEIKKGRRLIYQEIEIPTDDEILILATKLHSAQLPHKETTDAWHVMFEPSRPLNYRVTSYDPIGPHPSEVHVREVHNDIPSSLDIWSGDWIRPFWRISVSWHDGEGKSPVISRDFKNVIFPDSYQGDLFHTTPPEGQADPIKPVFEGDAFQIVATGYERNPEARRRCLAHHGTTCIACGFDFATTYGPVADGFIHVHHLTPISENAARHEVDPINDLAPLCPNCHAVAHLQKPPYSVSEIKAILHKARRIDGY